MGSRVKVLFLERIRLMYRERISIYGEVSGDTVATPYQPKRWTTSKLQGSEQVLIENFELL